MANVYDKLKSLGIELPTAGAPAAAYVMSAQSGNTVYLSGHIAKKDGKVWAGNWIPRNFPRSGSIDHGAIGRCWPFSHHCPPRHDRGGGGHRTSLLPERSPELRHSGDQSGATSITGGGTWTLLEGNNTRSVAAGIDYWCGAHCESGCPGGSAHVD